MPRSQYPDRAKVVEFQSALLQCVKTIPSVTMAALNESTIPPYEGLSAKYKLSNRNREETSTLEVNFVNGDYVSLLQTPLLAGRLLSGADVASRRPVALINEAMLRKYWHEPSEALGEKIALGDLLAGGNFSLPPFQTEFDIVGVVKNIRNKLTKLPVAVRVRFALFVFLVGLQRIVKFPQSPLYSVFTDWMALVRRILLNLVGRPAVPLERPTSDRPPCSLPSLAPAIG